MNLTPDRSSTTKPKKPTIRTVAIMVRAICRMKRGAEEWGKSKKIHEVRNTELRLFQ